jgi:hypothetical protein
MKHFLLIQLFHLLLGIGDSYCQVSDTLTKRGIVQFGYLSDNMYGESKGAFLQGVEGQVKWFFKAQKIVKGGRLKDVGYLNVGYTYFPNANYSLGQFNAGIGFALPVLWNIARMDIGIGAAGYHGSVGETTWSGTKIDFGGHAGISVPLGRRFGLYGKIWIPGAFTMLSEDTYIPPFFISAGIEF